MSRIIGELSNARIVRREPPHEAPQIVVQLWGGDKVLFEIDVTARTLQILQWAVETIDAEGYAEPVEVPDGD